MKTKKASSTEQQLEVVVEAARGSRAKYKFDEERRIFCMRKVLPLGNTFPFHFGFVPQTKGEDGDPLDVLVLTEGDAYPGVVIPVRLVGVLEAKQTERDGETVRNDRLIGVAACDDAYNEVKEPRDLGEMTLKDIASFFVSYNQARGVKFAPLGFKGPEKARRIVDEGRSAEPGLRRAG